MNINIEKIISLALLALLFLCPAGIGAKNAISYNQDGWDSLERGEDRKAMFSFRNALKQNPKFEDAILGLAKVYSNLKLNNDALQMFDTVLSMNPSSTAALIGAGFIFIEQGAFPKAMDYFERALKLSSQSTEAHYGIALLYFSMDRIDWSKRKIESILAVNPYHFDTLLLLAEIKSMEGRLREARELARRAIDADSESVKGYIRMSSVLLRDHLLTENQDTIDEAIYNLDTALAIQPDNFTANHMMADILLYKKKYNEAISFYKKCLLTASPPQVLYSLALSHEKTGDIDEALKYYLDALSADSTNEITASALEQFLVNHDYRIGHPANIMRSEYNFSAAQRAMKSKLPNEAILHIRRTLMLNPMNRAAREELMQYYSTLNYDRLYIDELKELQRLYPDKALQDKLNISIIKRRTKLYHREGFSAEMVDRNVPVVLVMDFASETRLLPHPNSGTVLANDLAFALQQFGRMKAVGFKKRRLVEGLRSDGDYFETSMREIENRIKSGDLPKIDFLVFGSCNEQSNRISLDLNLMDFKKGVIVSSFSLSDSGRNNALRIALRSANRIFDRIPFTGKILKVKDNSVIINLGLIDGVNPGSKLVIHKYDPKFSGVSRRIIFTVKESDTFVSEAEPQKVSDLDNIDLNDIVHSMEITRARMIKK
ncbi:MAG: tetratricopeptide repeat protein [Leptospirales bacterium]|nr:tetratricopeptide repeat protein [Leptospirales bacterium]